MLKVIKRIMAIVLVILIAAIAAIVIVAGSISAPKYKGASSDHFDGKKFFTPAARRPEGFGGVLKWMLNRDRGPWTEDLSEAYGRHPLAFERENIRITFINHSTFLIQVDGVNILTDPVYSMRASPFQWAGPRRMRLPGIKFEDLPRIDVVLISHNHYDHLDIQTIRTLFGGHHPQFITPLGVKALLDEEKITGASDLDWWQQLEIKNGVSITSVPAQHFSGRGLFDRDATLWCGYTIRTSKGVIYFAGDTGYNKSMFTEIGNKAGTIDIALLPIGAYKPYWFMSAVHTSPEDAVKAHIDLKSKTSIGIHFGTFPLADDGYEEPVKDLHNALARHNIRESDFVVLQQGEVRVFE